MSRQSGDKRHLQNHHQQHYDDDDDDDLYDHHQEKAVIWKTMALHHCQGNPRDNDLPVAHQLVLFLVPVRMCKHYQHHHHHQQQQQQQQQKE